MIPAAPFDGQARVQLVAYDRRHTTEVTRGENAGRTLVNHHVVRRLQTLGTWTGERLELAVDTSRAQARGREGLAVLIQRRGPGTILGAAQHALAAP